MLSRVAESLYWLGRYTERAENYARFIEVSLSLSMDLPIGGDNPWKPLIQATGDDFNYNQEFGQDYTQENVLHFLGFSASNQNSIFSSVSKARENARTVRESISSESWEVLNQTYYDLKYAIENKVWEQEDPGFYFKSANRSLQLLKGIYHNTSPRTQGWYFVKTGEHLERADKTSRILDNKYHSLSPDDDNGENSIDFLQWDALLKSVGALNSYRQVKQKLNPKEIVDYLVLNRYFPRSVLYCLMEAERCLHEISGTNYGYSNKAEKALGQLRSKLEYADIEEIFEKDLHDYLDNLQKKLNDISTKITDQYFRIRPNFDENPEETDREQAQTQSKSQDLGQTQTQTQTQVQS